MAKVMASVIRLPRFRCPHCLQPTRFASVPELLEHVVMDHSEPTPLAAP